MEKAGTLEAEGLLELSQFGVFLFTAALGNLFHLSGFLIWKMEIIIVTMSKCVLSEKWYNMDNYLVQSKKPNKLNKWCYKDEACYCAFDVLGTT